MTNEQFREEIINMLMTVDTNDAIVSVIDALEQIPLEVAAMVCTQILDSYMLLTADDAGEEEAGDYGDI